MRFLSIAVFAGLVASVAALPPNKLVARKSCDPGEGRQSASSGSCITCPANTFGRGGSEMCQTCPGGSTSSAGSSYCTCKAGYYKFGGVTTSDSCTACPAGQSSTSGAWMCTSCPANTYSVSGGLCTACPAGTTSATGASQCVPLSCPAGKYLSGNTCATCPAGTYSTAGAASCSDCAAGSISNAGSSTCTACPAGSVPTASGNTCIACGRNTFSDGDNCSPCPAGSTSNPGSSSCGPQPSKRAQPVLASVPQCSGPGMQLCDVLSGFGGKECINIFTTLDSCGGCVGPEGDEDTTGKYTGRDCSVIPHVDEVKCVRGGCEIKSCRAGYEPSGGSCVEQAAYTGKNQTAHVSRAKRTLLGSRHDTF